MLDRVAFTVPYLTPPSVNHYKTPTMYKDKTGTLRRGQKLTKEAKAYKAAVAIFSRGETVSPESDAARKKVAYRVLANIYLGKGARLDADNGGKLICDALEYAGVIHSDAFVQDFHPQIFKQDRDNPRTEFIVTRMERQ